MTEILEHNTETTASSAELAANRSWIKASFDRAAAFLGLLVISPFLLGVAILIRLDSRGPVLFAQARYGRGGQVFRIYKFRTMTADASNKPFLQATTNDVRVTRLGKFLRNSSIDELPQLINVVRGEMALVGPRPHPLALDDKFKELIPDYMQRYQVLPGLTGLAQVSGHRGATPTVEAMAARVAFDLEYIDRWTLWLDVKILLRTILFVVRGAL